MNEPRLAQQKQKLLAQLQELGVRDAGVLKAIAAVPREQFVSLALVSQAYENKTLPIGEGQTISKPYIVALMTLLLELEPSHKVLEIGTGSGYQAAVLCKLVRRLYSIERFPSLAAGAEKILRHIGVHNFTAIVADGSLGWPEQAPFDRIIVTAGAPHVPQSLVDQLAPNGILVIPGGPTEGQQKLVRIRKNAEGELSHEVVGNVKFVPLIGAQAAGEKRRSRA